MKKHILLQTNVETSRLGFGCVQLTAHHNRREALSVVEHAFSLGITHFDVARAYGFGRAEGILREFLRQKRHDVTLTTKFGIEPPSGLAGNARVINALKKVLRRFPGLLRHAKNRGAAMVKARIFTPEAAIRSLETSLRELGTDYVDIFLLHEGTLADASSAPLVEALLSQVAKGKIRHLGVGSAFQKFQFDADLLPAAYEVLQFNDNAVDRSVGKLLHRDRRFLITHSVFAPAEPLRQAVKAHPQIAREHSLRMGIDLAEPSAIGSLLLRFALWSNADGIVLFSSKDPQHIGSNVREADSEPYDDARMHQFVEFVDQILDAMSPGPGVTDSHGTGTLSGPS
jgi:aryl-alcohol dehydrogenase-like predicted oxidoreductase